MRLVFLVAAALLFFSAAAFGADPSIVKGKVTHAGVPVEGAYVNFYRDASQGMGAKPDFRAGPTPADGSFELSMPDGSWFLIAVKKVSGTGDTLGAGDLFAFYGGNPVVTSPGQSISIGINAPPIMPVAEKFIPGEESGLRGVVYQDGEPVQGARITLYQEADTIFRGIGYASTMTGPGGKFSLHLEPGKYYAVARKRQAEGDKLGPLTTGDLFAFSHENPLEIKAGGFTVISLNAVAKMSKVKEGGQEVTLGGTVKAGVTTISGVVRDASGKPVSGIHVGAYRDSMMIYKPDFISNQTGPDGSYTINLSGDGEYFLLARDTMGGPALKGDRLGKYNGNEDHSVKLKTGDKVEHIDITVEIVQ